MDRKQFIDLTVTYEDGTQETFHRTGWHLSMPGSDYKQVWTIHEFRLETERKDYTEK